MKKEHKENEEMGLTSTGNLAAFADFKEDAFPEEHALVDMNGSTDVKVTLFSEGHVVHPSWQACIAKVRSSPAPAFFFRPFFSD